MIHKNDGLNKYSINFNLMLYLDLEQANNYKEGMKQSYDKFCLQIKMSGIDEINKSLENCSIKPIQLENHAPETVAYSQKFKSSPWVKTKEGFENRENLYLRVIDLMKMFIRFEEKDFLKFACKQTNLGHIINKIQIYRLSSPEFQLLFYLIRLNNRKLIALYIKLRNEMLTRCGHNQTKHLPVSIHNQNKNFTNENVELGSIKVDYMFWGPLAEMSKSYISQDMLWWLSNGQRKLPAVDFLKACIWAHQTNSDNPESTP